MATGTIQGQYKGQNIYAGSDAEVAAQMRAIDAQSAPKPQPAAPIPATSSAPPQQPLAVQPQQAAPYVPPDIKTLEAGIATSYAPQEQQLKSEGDSFQQSIQNILQKQTQEASRTAEIEGQVGIPDLNRNLNEITNQIRSLNAEAFSATQNAEGRAAPMFAIQGEQERIQRLNAARQYGLAATAQAMQGSLALAQDTVERAIKAEFGGLDAQLKYYSYLYENNRDKLQQIDEKKARALEIALQDRAEMIANQKEQKSQIYQLAMQAAQNNAPAALISQLLNSRTFDDALLAASQAGILAPTADGGFTLSAGQTRYDANGNVIARNTGVGGGGTGSVGAASGVGIDTQENLTKAVQTVLASGKFTAQQRADVVNLLNSQGLEGARQWWVNNKFSESDRDSYNIYDTSSDILLSVAQQLTDNPQEAGPYKALLEDRKPWLLIQRDPQYADLRQQIEIAQAQIRKGFYGTAVTGAELGNAKNFLITGDEDPANLLLKVQGLAATLKFVNDANALRPFGIDVSYDDYRPDTAVSFNWSAYTPSETSDIQFSPTDSGEYRSVSRKLYDWGSALLGF